MGKGPLFILAGLACLTAASEAAGSAWNPEPGHGELISGLVMIEASRATDDRGDTFDLDIYNKKMAQSFGIVGLTPKLAFLGTLDWQETQIAQPGLSIAYSEASSITAGFQYQTSLRPGHATAISVSYVHGIDFPDALITVENRRSNLEVRGLWGESRTWRGRSVFAEAQLAGRLRFNGLYDSVHAQLTVGRELSDRLSLLGKGRFSDIGPGTLDDFDVSAQNRWEAELSGIYRLRKNDFIELSYSTVLTGRNTVLENEWKLGFWSKF